MFCLKGRASRVVELSRDVGTEQGFVGGITMILVNIEK